MGKLKYTVILLIGVLMLETGCSSDDQVCDHSSDLINENNICLVFEHEGLSNDLQNNIESEIVTGISDINQLMPINDLKIRIVEDPNRIIPEIGMGGYNPNDREVILAIDAAFSNLDSSLEENLVAQLAHEVHHAKRRRSVGYGSTLLEAVVTEGLADHFSIEVTGIDPPPWSIAVTGQTLQDWINTAGDTWNQPGYDHSAWFFGVDGITPKWTGYSIGYELVKNYLTENPGKQPSTLHAEPASSFQP